MAKNKTFAIQAQRVYRSDFEYKASSIEEIENMINWNTDRVTQEMCEDLWDVLSEIEMSNMDCDTIEYEITEVTNSKNNK